VCVGRENVHHCVPPGVERVRMCTVVYLRVLKMGECAPLCTSGLRRGRMCTVVYLRVEKRRMCTVVYLRLRREGDNVHRGVPPA